MLCLAHSEPEREAGVREGDGSKRKPQGQTISQAFAQAVANHRQNRLAEAEALEIEMIVPSRWLSWLKPGDDFKVQIEENGKTYPARVVRLGGRVDPVSQSIKVIGEIAQGAPELMAGMSGQVMMNPPALAADHQ